MRNVFCLLACLIFVTASSAARADQATPIIEQGNQVGDRTTVQGFIVSLGYERDGVAQYLVIVRHGCMPDVMYTIPAEAGLGIVVPDALGRPVQFSVVVTEQITVNESGRVRGKVRIDSVAVMECEG